MIATNTRILVVNNPGSPCNAIARRHSRNYNYLWPNPALPRNTNYAFGVLKIKLEVVCYKKTFLYPLATLYQARGGQVRDEYLRPLPDL